MNDEKYGEAVFVAMYRFGTADKPDRMDAVGASCSSNIGTANDQP